MQSQQIQAPHEAYSIARAPIKFVSTSTLKFNIVVDQKVTVDSRYFQIMWKCNIGSS